MNVSLTPELEKLVDDKVASGMYHSASEVVREALRLLKAQDELRRQRLEAFRSDIAVGLQQLKDGQSEILDDKALQAIKQRGRVRLAEQSGNGNT